MGYVKINFIHLFYRRSLSYPSQYSQHISNEALNLALTQIVSQPIRLLPINLSREIFSLLP
jgi:hypothetical protein